MNRRVAVWAVAQIKNEPDIWYRRFQGMLILVMGHCKESQTESRNMNTNTILDIDHFEPIK